MPACKAVDLLDGPLSIDSIINLKKAAAVELLQKLGISEPSLSHAQLQARLLTLRESARDSIHRAEFANLTQALQLMNDRLTKLETREDHGKALQPRVVALEREVPTLSGSPAIVAPPAIAMHEHHFEQAVQEAQQRTARMEQFCVAKLPVLPEESPVNLQARVQTLLTKDMGISSEDSQILSAKRMHGKAGCTQ